MNLDTEALSEIDEIMGMMSKEELKKIPEKFKEFVKNKKSQAYKPNIDKNIPLHKQNLKEDTKTMCSLIYRSYLCNQEDKNRFNEGDKEYFTQKEQEVREKYNPDNVFKKKNISMENTDIIEYKEPKWYQKIFAKIVNLFKK